MERKYIIQDAPNWNLEAMGFLEEVRNNKIESIIESHNKFGKTKEEMVSFFQPYKDYKYKLKDEILAIYEKYKKMKMIFQMEERLEKDDLNLGVTLMNEIEQKYQRDLSEEDIDELIGEHVLNITRSLDEDLEPEIKIKSLEELIQVLESADLSDGEKMLMISLYGNRYEVIEEIQKFAKEARAVLEENYHMIQEEYERAIEDLSNVDNLNILIEKIVPMKLVKTIVGSIVLTIFPLGSLYMKYRDEGLWINIGIYVFLLGNWKKERGFQGIELLAGLKALGDETRLKIISKVAEKPMYIQQLSEELELTPATISHHINLLLKERFVNIIVEADKSKKIYYEVNKYRLKELGATIESLGDENKGGLDFDGKTTKVSFN